MNSVVFRNPIDILVITSNKYLIAHRFLTQAGLCTGAYLHWRVI